MIINYISKPGGGEPIPAPAVHEELIYTSLGTTTVKDDITYNNVKLTGINYSGSTKTEVSIPETFEDGGINYYISQINNDFLIHSGSSVGSLTKIWIMGSEYSWKRERNQSVQMIPSGIKNMLLYASPINSAYSDTLNNDKPNYIILYGSNLEVLTFVGSITQISCSEFFKDCFLPSEDNSGNNPFRYLSIIYGNNVFAGSNLQTASLFPALESLKANSGTDNGVFRGSSLINFISSNLKYLQDCTINGNGAYKSGHFANCYSLITFKAPLTSIPRQTFKGSNHLKTITLTGNVVPTISFGDSSGYSPFSDCSALEHIYVKAALVNDVKTLFANAGYTTWGSNLESLVSADPDE